MTVTGFVTIIVGLFYGLVIDKDQTKIVERLTRTAVIRLGVIRFLEIRSQLRCIAALTTLLSPVVLALIYLIAVYNFDDSLSDLICRPGGHLALICVGLVSLRFGRYVSICFTNWVVFDKKQCTLLLLVNHPDRCGGIASIGNYFLKHASTGIIPIVWVLCWILIISYHMHIKSQDYIEYNGLLFPLAIYLIILGFLYVGGFFFSMYPLSRKIKCWKNSLRPHVNQLVRNMQKQRHYTGGSFAINQVEIHATYLYSFFRLSDWGISPGTKTAIFTALSTLIVSTVFSFVIAAYVTIR